MVKFCICAPLGRQFDGITEYAKREGVFDIFGEAERERIARISSRVARALSLGGLVALKMLTDTVAMEEKGLDILRAEGGKPYFSGNTDYSFSITHSGELSAAALTTDASEIGVDIERIEANRDIRKISERFFTPTERELLECSDYDRSEFYKIWTAKEARAKRGGEGLSRLLAHGDDRNDEGYLCHYLVRYGGEEYVMAVSLSATDSIEVLTPHRDIEILEIQESVKK